MTGSNCRHPACKAGALPAELIAHIKGKMRFRTIVWNKAIHTKSILILVLCFFGDPYEIRTREAAVKGRCLNRLTNGPLNQVSMPQN
ncbi:MAG: hypothetical protein H6Q70_4058 [Firmicutes bacterium]|nr:hypothetical protein [Bacillota bacterium]